MKQVICATALTLLGTLCLATGALAGASDAEKCEAAKVKHAGKYASCRTNAEAKAIKKGREPDYSKCDSKLGDKFDKAEAKWGEECPTLGDEDDVRTQVSGDTDDIVALLSTGRFEDTGLTIIDHQTGLEWEKKTGPLGAPRRVPEGRLAAIPTTSTTCTLGAAATGASTAA